MFPIDRRLSKCRSHAMHNFVEQRKKTKVQTDRENEKMGCDFIHSR